MFTFKKLMMILFPLTMVITSVCAGMNDGISVSSPGLSLVRKATYISPVSSSTIIHFIVYLKLRNKEKLDQLIGELYDRNNSNYHKFLTKDEFDRQYAPTPDVEYKVQQYFIARGMQAKIINHSVRVTARVQQVEQTFQLKINHYRYQNRIVYANATAPILSPEIAQYVAEISGLSNIVHFHPFYKLLNKSMKKTQPHELHLIWNSFTPAVQPTTTSIGGFSGAQLQTTYNIANIPKINNTSISGTGQTIVLIDACGANSAATITSDANQYNSTNGFKLLTLGQNFTVINPDGSPYTTCGAAPPTGWEVEIALDVESAHTIAPDANIVLVLAPTQNDLESTVMDVASTLESNNHTIASFSNASVVSNSWGFYESSGVFPSMETTLETAAANGISFSFSSGDCGDNFNTCEFVGQIEVNYPSSSAFVTSIGGTSAFVDNSWNYAFETGWGTFTTQFVYGGGGGISQDYGPVTWQNSISNFTAGGYTAGTVGHYDKRALPDVAMLADPTTGLNIYEAYDGGWMVIGGTSLACPVFSATLGLVNQARALLSKSTPIGLAAPYLYNENSTLRNASALNLIIPPHQIISGATPPPGGAPLSAFTIGSTTFSWDSTLTIEPEDQFWNDVAGVGSPNIPNFVGTMANM